MRFLNRKLSLITMLTCIIVCFSACQSEHAKLDYSSILYQFASDHHFAILSESDGYAQYDAELQNNGQIITLHILKKTNSNDWFELSSTVSSKESLNYAPLVDLANHISNKQFRLKHVSSVIESKDPYFNYKKYFPNGDEYKEYKEYKVGHLDLSADYSFLYCVDDLETYFYIGGIVKS